MVYYFPVNGAAEESIISYKGDAGDTVHLTNGSFVIQEVYYDSLFGLERKVIVINDLYSIIEGAGSSRYGIHNDYGPPPPWPTLIDLQMSNASCESITSTNQLTASISIYPNPFTDFIIIANPDSAPGYYEVYNSFGIRLLSGAFMNETTVETKALIPGIYLLVINRSIIKLIKQ